MKERTAIKIKLAMNAFTGLVFGYETLFEPYPYNVGVFALGVMCWVLVWYHFDKLIEKDKVTRHD